LAGNEPVQQFLFLYDSVNVVKAAISTMCRNLGEKGRKRETRGKERKGER